VPEPEPELVESEPELAEDEPELAEDEPELAEDEPELAEDESELAEDESEDDVVEMPVARRPRAEDVYPEDPEDHFVADDDATTRDDKSETGG
jgi:hypothetical protein